MVATGSRTMTKRLTPGSGTAYSRTLTAPAPGGLSVEQNENNPVNGPPLVPAQLAFSIGLAVARSRDLLRRILKEHVTDNAREMRAKRVIEHLERSGFELDEAEQVMRKRPPTRWHG